jgi:hypothetical protein
VCYGDGLEDNIKINLSVVCYRGGIDYNIKINLRELYYGGGLEQWNSTFFVGLARRCNFSSTLCRKVAGV